MHANTCPTEGAQKVSLVANGQASAKKFHARLPEPTDKLCKGEGDDQAILAMTYTPEKATGVSETWKVTLPSYSMLALTLIGIADAVYVSGTPMSYFGFIYYVFMFGLAARVAFNPFSSGLRFRAILYAALGAASSMYFIYLQLGIIRAVCSYCLISAVTSFLLLLAALWHFQATRNRR